jgi:transcriptional antiterminator RfaH
MKQWFVVHTQPCKETVACQHLEEQGYETYLPRFRKTRKHARKVEQILAPLFPRYLFISFDTDKDQWRSVQGTRGVSYLLTTDNKPAEVPLRIVQSLKDRQTDEGLVAINTIMPFAKGDKVRVLDGAFKEHIAVFDKMDDKQRVQLLLNWLGREIAVCLPSYAVGEN